MESDRWKYERLHYSVTLLNCIFGSSNTKTFVKIARANKLWVVFRNTYDVYQHKSGGFSNARRSLAVQQVNPNGQNHLKKKELLKMYNARIDVEIDSQYW